MLLYQNALPLFRNAKAVDRNQHSISTIGASSSDFLTALDLDTSSLHHSGPSRVGITGHAWLWCGHNWARFMGWNVTSSGD